MLAALRRDYPHVSFTGKLTGRALAAEYDNADVFVFPSRTDTFGLVLLEALACGTPVAAYPVTGPSDVLGHATEPVGALDDDLRAACLAALHADRRACRRHAEGFSWASCAMTFSGALVPFAWQPARRPAPGYTLKRKLQHVAILPRCIPCPSMRKPAGLPRALAKLADGLIT